jgi:predicted Zn finger-like uncharacterized protein
MTAAVTRCPQCGTAFRAFEEQLAARGGLVRCGKCANVFDGIAHRVADDAPAEASPQLRLFEPAAAPGARVRSAEPASVAAHAAATTTAAAAAPAARRTSSTKAAPPEEDEPLPEFLEEMEPRTRFTLVWALGALLAFGALLAQLALYYRTELATLVPQTRPHLAEACGLLGCELRLPRRPDLLSIESSDLQADNRREGLIVLNAVIRNRAPFAQEHPALELTLTDAADKAVVRRVLQPADYLSAAARASIAQGIAAGGESVLRVHFDTGGVHATGYRVYLFYPS